MKKILISLLLVLPIFVRAQGTTVMVKGTMNSTQPTTIHVYYYNKFTHVTVFDSVAVVNGKFTLNVPFHDLAVSVGMLASYNNKGIQEEDKLDGKLFFVDQQGASIHIEDKISTAVISDSRLEDERQRYVKYLYQPGADSAKMGHLNGTVAMVITKVTAVVPDSVSQPKLFAGYKEIKAFMAVEHRFLEQRYDRLRKYIKSNPDSYFSTFAISELIYAGKDWDKIPAYNGGLSQRLRGSQEVKFSENLLARMQYDKTHPKELAASKVAKEIKVSATGEMAPDFMQLDVNDKPVKLSDFKGQYVLVDFWASWCVPCRKENPNVVKAYQQYKNKNFTVLGVALESKGSRAAWLAAIKKDGLTWTQIADIQKGENPAAKAFGISGIPMSFLIDPSGRIIAKDIRGEVLLDKLADVLSN